MSSCVWDIFKDGDSTICLSTLVYDIMRQKMFWQLFVNPVLFHLNSKYYLI